MSFAVLRFHCYHEFDFSEDGFGGIGGCIFIVLIVVVEEKVYVAQHQGRCVVLFGRDGCGYRRKRETGDEGQFVRVLAPGTLHVVFFGEAQRFGGRELLEFLFRVFVDIYFLFILCIVGVERDGGCGFTR